MSPTVLTAAGPRRGADPDLAHARSQEASDQIDRSLSLLAYGLHSGVAGRGALVTEAPRRSLYPLMSGCVESGEPATHSPLPAGSSAAAREALTSRRLGLASAGLDWKRPTVVLPVRSMRCARRDYAPVLDIRGNPLEVSDLASPTKSDHRGARSSQYSLRGRSPGSVLYQSASSSLLGSRFT